ncbi:MAG: FAD-dependent oxidoreductase, partial [Deltaproteobacteria bacterium]|nr:FAD-dependent oxidoreductase [Deltaproteobacteria bacterium]
MERNFVHVIGAGLAGSEAAWQLARRGVHVRLFEMRPMRMTDAHQTGLFGELVCSNSLRNDSLETAVGVLKEEMRRLGSLIIFAAGQARVPAGAALAVDRNDFASIITKKLESHPLIEIVRSEVAAIPDGPAIIATGPLTSAALGDALSQLIGP